MVKPIVTILLGALATSPVLAADDVEQRKKASMQATKVLLTELSSVLKKQIKASGPAEAINVCRELAPSITGRISNANGWQMTRVSHKYRNSLLGMPDGWEKSVLKKFEQRKKAGESLKTMAYSEVVTDPTGEKYFRFMKALPVKEVCLTCHGSKKDIPAGVQTKLNLLYPLDKATGFKKGDLRGAISIRQPMNVPLRKEGIGWE